MHKIKIKLALISKIHRYDLMAILLIWGSSILTNYPLFFGKIPFNFDILAFYYPLFSLSLIRPILLWSPYQFSGFPVFAEPQFAMFYPLRWIFYFMDIYSAMPLFYIIHFILGSIFIYLFLRHLGLGRIAAIAGSIAFIQGSYLQSRFIMSGTLFYSMVWIPLFMLWGFRAIENKSIRESIIAGWVMGIISLIGSPHHQFYPLLALAIYFIFYNLYQRDFGILIKSSINFILLTFIGLGISAIQNLPARELFIRSVRANLSFEQIVETSLRTEWIWGSFLGGTQTPEFLDASAYFGLMGIILLPILILNQWNKNIKIWYFLSIAILGVWIARGEYAFFYHIFYQIPVLESLSFPCRSLILLSFSGPILTAYTIENIIQIRNQKNIISKGNYILLIIIFIMPILSLGYLYYRTGLILYLNLLDAKWADATLFRWSRLAIFTIIILSLIGLYWRNKIQLRLLGILLCLILISDLLHFSPRLQKEFINAEEYLSPPPAAQFLKNLKQSNNIPPGRILGFHGARLYSIDQQDNRFKGHIIPRLAELYRLPDAQGYDPLMLQRYADFMKFTAGRSPTEDPQRMATIAKPNPNFLNIMNVEYIIGEINEYSIYRGQLILTTGQSSTFMRNDSVPITEIGILSLLDQHFSTPQGTVIGRIIITDKYGVSEQIPIRAGIETGDWRELSPTINRYHQLLPAAMTWRTFMQGKEYLVHNYYQRIKLSRPIIASEIRFEHRNIPGIWVIQNITLIRQNDKNQFEKIFESDFIPIYRNKTVYPRAFMVHEIKTIHDENYLLETLANPDIDLRNIAYLEEYFPYDLQIPNKASLVQITEYNSGQIKITIENETAGLLVLSEIDYPGWQARVNGEIQKIYTTNYILRGIYIAAGKNQVILEFKPLSLYIGLIITMVTLISTVAIYIYLYRTR